MKNNLLIFHKSSGALLLGIIIFATAFASDHFLDNSLISIPLLLASLVSALLTNWFIRNSKKLKIGQVIRKEGPEKHKNKAGTPTMGGLIVIPVGVLIGSLITSDELISQKLVVLSSTILCYMIIGGIDDLKGLKEKRNKGLSPKNKIILQSIVTILFLLIAASKSWIDSTIMLPFDRVVDIGILIWPLSFFVFLAESNATNLTDGLDGLAAGCGALVFMGMALQLVLRGDYGDPVLAGYSAAMAGAWLGFLSKNQNPAKVFMGDTGSLSMGASLAGIALLSNSLWALFLMGGVFLAESVSVILQVGIFKATKNSQGVGIRILKMAPLHHHFELLGVDEKVLVPIFWLLTGLLVILTLFTIQ